ncbi:MAG: thiamine-monophosphate kinase, partial [Verrucomicrobiaceae bacterium]
PEHFLITLALPAETEVVWVEDFYRGIGDCLDMFGGFLAGGETSGVPSGSAAVISIAATGSVQREHLILRSTARAGDALFVTGTLGGSIHGKHLDFTPRVEAAGWLVRNFKPSAMMDLSDGLGKDLPRLAKASGCGFSIDETAIPVTTGSTVAEAIGDGEDFELLFCLEESRADGLLQAWPFADLPLTRIGRMEEDGKEQALGGGWEHFRS